MLTSRSSALVALGVLTLLMTGAQRGDKYEAARSKLVEKEVAGAGVTDQRVLRSMSTTLRHEFVPRKHRPNAYYDMSLPIGSGQTISSPFIVAYMTESLEPQPTDVVLEIGTGSGYQAAVLSPLVKEVYTIEIVESLGRRAAQTLRRLKYENVHTRIGDGFAGWTEHAPFDKIIVTCSPENVPQALVEQLREGGRMVIPVGERYQQTLYLLQKRDGKLVRESLRPTLFVPMTGRAEQLRAIQPDATQVRVVNGSFEEPQTEEEHITGWYYQRQGTVVADKMSPHGGHHVRFENRTPGRGCRALQGFAIDGREIENLDVSAWIKLQDVSVGTNKDMLPAIAITFYDEHRRGLGNRWLGPWQGTSDWRRVQGTIRVPKAAREGILRVGLFGAVGEFLVDDLRAEAAVRRVE